MWQCHTGLGISSFTLRSFAPNRSFYGATVSNSLFKKERCEWFARDSYFSFVVDSVSPFYAKEGIAHVAFSLIRSLLKSDLSDLLPRHSLQKSDCERFAHVALSLTKSERFARKTDEQIPNPGVKRILSQFFF